MLKERIESLKGQMSDMISLAKEEQRSLTEEEIAKCEEMKAEISRLRKSVEIDNLASEWAEAEKAEIRKARVITKSEDDEMAEERRSLENYILRGQTEGTGAYGGYTVPTKLHDWIVSTRDAANYMRRLGTVVNISGTVNVPVESTDISAYWVAESGSLTEGTQSFSQAVLKPYKACILDKLSTELIQDSAFDLYAYIANKAGRVLGQTEETAFIKGSNGNNEPEGLLSAGITPSRTSSGTQVAAQEIIDFFYTLPAQYQANASWLISGDLAAKLAGLTTGTGGIFAWGGNLADGAPARLMGKPCYVSQNLDAVQTNKIIAIVGDLSYYYIGDAGGIQIQRLNELFAATDSVGIKVQERVAGVLTNPAAVKVLGTKTT